MEILNLAVVALLKSLERNHIDQDQLLVGTDLKMGNILKPKKMHSWDQFVIMYENCIRLLGENKAAKEIAYQGIYNNEMSSFRKMGAGFFDPKSAYWAIATFISKYLFKECVNFQYRKIAARHVRMTITINPKLKDCPMFLETYTYIFEKIPTLLGQPKAQVLAKISERKGEYDIYFKKASPFKDLVQNFLKFKEGYKSTITVLSELEAQSEELSKLIEEKSQLLQILSHDISNQVGIVDFYLNKTLRSENLTEENLRNLEMAHKSTRRLCDILRNVQKLEISQITGVMPEPVELEPIFLSLTNQYAPQIDKKSLSFSCFNELPVGVRVVAEKTSLELNILGNLISNAIKFSPEGSAISLNAKLCNDKILISVLDQGAGISMKEIEGIFDRKIRSSTLGTNGETGAGFGLGIVYNYTSLLEGKISIQPNQPYGSIFTIELPAHIPTHLIK